MAAKRKPKFKVGQRVWCKLCRKATRIVAVDENGSFETSCYKNARVTRDALRPLTKRERGDAMRKRELCGQCGKSYGHRACGLTHALIAAERKPKRKMGPVARVLEKARAEAVGPVQLSLEAQAIETGRILARENALRERLENLSNHWHTYAISGRKSSRLKDCANQLRAALSAEE